MKLFDTFLLFLIILIILVVTSPIWIMPVLGGYIGYEQEKEEALRRQIEAPIAKQKKLLYLEKQPSLVITGVNAEEIRVNLRKEHFQEQILYINENPEYNLLTYRISIPYHKKFFMTVLASDKTKLLEIDASIQPSSSPNIFSNEDIEFLTFIAQQTASKSDREILHLWLVTELQAPLTEDRTSQLILKDVDYTFTFTISTGYKIGVARLSVKKLE